MKIKLKDGMILPNNWKSCKCTKEDWDNLNSGKSIEVSSVPELIKDNVEVIESITTKIKKKASK